jgi:hypothetical protein
MKCGATFASIGQVTWGAGGSTADLTLQIAKTMHAKVGMNTMMHLV